MYKMKRILITVLFAVSLLTAAGEKEFAKLLNDLSVVLDNLSVKVENAKTGNDVAKALKQFTKDCKPLAVQKKKLEKQYPVLFKEDAELPSSVIPQAEKLTKSSERYNEAMTLKVELMDEETVQLALDESEKIFIEFSSLLGSEEDEMEDEEDE